MRDAQEREEQRLRQELERVDKEERDQRAKRERGKAAGERER
jgi:hypothetical protein